MRKLAYYEKDPETAYVANNLWLPKSRINTAVVKSALTFQLDEEEPVLDEAGVAIGTRMATMKMWDETAHHLIVPRHFLKEEQYPSFRCEFVRLPYHFEKARIEDRITLRDEDQPEAFAALLEHDHGTLNLACGKGKTIIALKLAATLKTPTIVVVNTTALLEQWKEEIFRHIGVKKVGVLQGDSGDWHAPVVLAMVHTLSNRRDRWPMAFRRRFGLVLYDEGHHMSAPVFVKSADLFFGRRYSLTATAQRTDGLEKVYQYHLGRVIHTNLTQDLIPHTVFHKLVWTMPEEDRPLVIDKARQLCTPKIRTYLGTLDWRNRLIYECLLSDLEEGRTILVLSHSVEHVDRMHSYLSAAGAGMIVGMTDQGSRMPILRAANPVFGTFQLAREGLNKPALDTLYVTTPFSNSNDLQQSWGRIQRKYADKLPPLVRVFEDTAFKRCISACNTLRGHLNKLNYPWERVVHNIGEPE